jgi:glycine/D-amino acid oxidase-like deaminating enzyme
VGLVPGWDAVYLATGHSGEGIHYGPVTADAVATLIAYGKSDHDIEPLSPARASITTV